MKAYCINKKCPYKDCDRHISHIREKTGVYTFANLDSVCERYIRYLAKREVRYENYKRFRRKKRI